MRLKIPPPAVRLAASAAVILTVGCSSNTPSSPNAPSPNTLHAEVTDPIGDAVVSSGVATAPDLTHGIVDVAAGNVTFTIQFAPGSLDRQTTLLGFELDTDQNASTGIPAGAVGIDYHIGFRASASSAIVEKATPSTCVPANGASCYTSIGTAPIGVGTDSLTVTVSLAMLGGASGRMNYQVFSYAAPPTSAPTSVADVMPDLNLPPAHVP